MIDRPNVLVVCGRNKRRSRTAEYIFKNDSRINIRSAGLSSKSSRKLTAKDLLWSDLIFVMEYSQRRTINGLYRDLDLPPIEVLNIPDAFDFMEPELVALLRDGINDALRIAYKMGKV